jgi:signal transduction histidine kinase/CheY-like chemotaxis protein/purine-cytosine permease-like protein
MNAPQQIFRVRRQYNQWVNNQTLEDYALRFTAKHARRWSPLSVATTALGGISFLALEAIGAVNTLSFGVANTLIATLWVALIIFIMGTPICYYAAKYGLDIDLLTRGAGFGYLGSTITSLIYASFTFIFFALEAAIMALALEHLLHLPLIIGYVVCSLVVIPLVTFGITLISQLQKFTQPLWIILQLLPFIALFSTQGDIFGQWAHYPGNSGRGEVHIMYWGAAASVLFALVAQIGEQVDYLRFMPEKTAQNRWQWWGNLILAGPGWILLGAAKIIAGSLLAYLAIGHGLSEVDASDPTHMYRVGFSYLTDSPQLALILAASFVVVSQIKINVTNAYAGSIAWSNFFSRLTHSHPGRVVWLIFNVFISLALMELGIYQAFEATLGIYALIALAWLGSLFADLMINKPLKLSPQHIEFKRAYLYSINPVGVGSMILASVVGVASYLGVFGLEIKAWAPFITLGCTLITVPAIAWLTQGRYYLARENSSPATAVSSVCCICQNTYEPEDIAQCPAYAGPICSLCCSLDSRCNDACKPKHNTTELLLTLAQKYLRRTINPALGRLSVHFLSLFILLGIVTSVLLHLVLWNLQPTSPDTQALLQQTLLKVFFILMIIAGVIIWLVVLAHESRQVAQDESQRQNRLLLEEISAHRETDLQLQQAKEHAEAANNAKSRYLTGISHELRTPLNAILGYAQLLEHDKEIPLAKREKITVMRNSSQHLEDLIEGLLDISKIESGRLDIRRNRVNIRELLEQVVSLFRLQAEGKNLVFIYQLISPLPERVITDEQRLRQILINLLSNAIKYTQEGYVKLQVKYRNQVAEFSVEDSGVGIDVNDRDIIFKPFERIRRPGVPSVTGTGLGLTITRLLVDIMGGEIEVSANAPQGTRFTVWLMLSSVVNTDPIQAQTPQQPLGYLGEKKTVVVVDDDPAHRGLIGDILIPLGFNVVECADAESLLKLRTQLTPDIFLLDVNLPGMQGWELVHHLRHYFPLVPLIMLSANVHEEQGADLIHPLHTAYLLKPIKIAHLLDVMQKSLALEWLYTPEDLKSLMPAQSEHTTALQLDAGQIEQAIEWAKNGYFSALKTLFNSWEEQLGADNPHTPMLKTMLHAMQFNHIIDYLSENV